jgi:FdhD protein
MNLPNDNGGHATASMTVHRLPAGREETDRVAAERAVTLMIDQVGSFTVMCTPTQIEALAAGFCFSEGLIADADDIAAIVPGRSNSDAVAIQLDHPPEVGVERNLIVASSCGMCGARNIAKLMAAVPAVASSLTISERGCQELPVRLREAQPVFEATGGVHAAAVFDAGGATLSSAEDIGRHNAMDKAIGACLLAGRATAGCGIVLSGRVSFELVAKAARAGIELILAVSGPTSLAVEAADGWNITLCGFVRGDRMNVYTHPQRIRELAE